MEPSERLELLERALDDLREESRAAPIVVEGVRDEAALRALDVRGEILVYNSRSILGLADHLRHQPRVILLFDWDRKGGQLTQLLVRQLTGQVRIDLELRKALARASLVKCVEDLPAALRSLRRRVAGEKAER